MKIGILVDSSTGFIEKEHNTNNIKVLPLHLIVDDKDDYLDTPEEIKNNDLITILASGKKTTTSQASPGELMNKYDEMLKEFDHIIHMTIPSNLSGMHQTAVMIANDEDYKGKITVIENFLAANCAQLLALKFDEMIKEGIEDPKKYQEESDKWTVGSWTAIIPSDLQKMSKGGRANSLLITMLKMIKAKVAIQWLAKPKKIGMGRTYGSVLDKMIVALKKEITEDFELLLVSLPEVKKAHIEQIKKYLKANDIKFKESKIPTVYPWHAGIDTIGLIAVKKTLLAKK
ncbi:DegV family protein [Spiroplasma floricola]|uniref:DegV family protein n=1 Tax=Spiroplasma floricola 23-6 TaxID=1336749 RepID=A0A2K8SEY5_9MOLU|nr:DegV family protein [Spiroplasma floricola]AUB31992.1 DegV family protein [Spiroplasma floricola 23-6]